MLVGVMLYCRVAVLPCCCALYAAMTGPSFAARVHKAHSFFVR